MLCTCFQIFWGTLWLCLCLHVALRCLSAGAAKTLVTDVADRHDPRHCHRSGPTQLCRSVPHSWPDVKPKSPTFFIAVTLVDEFANCEVYGDDIKCCLCICVCCLRIFANCWHFYFVLRNEFLGDDLYFFLVCILVQCYSCLSRSMYCC